MSSPYVKMFGIMFLSLAFIVPSVQAQETRQSEREAMYYRYLEFSSLVKGGSIQPHWMADGSSFWYTEGSPDSTIIFKVNSVNNTKIPFFETERLRAALRRKLGHEPPGKGVPFDKFDLIHDETAVIFSVEKQHFLLQLDDYSIDVVSPPEEKAKKSPPTYLHPLWRYPVEEKPSPDGRWFAGIENDNLYVLSKSDDKKVKLTTDGTSDFWWEVAGWPNPAAMWSPDASILVSRKIDCRNVSKIPIVNYRTPIEEVEWVYYPWAGEPQPRTELFFINVLSRQQVKVELRDEKGMNVFLLQWHPSGKEFYLLRVGRYYQQIELLAADPKTGSTRTLLTEFAETGYLYDHPERELVFTFLPASNRFIWRTDRDGWDHLYLYDLNGTLIRRLTIGAFPVERVVAVDEEQGWVYFTARADSNRIYDTHLYRVDLNGEKFQRLTEAPGQHEERFVGMFLHKIQFSPSKEFFLDTHSNPDRPPRVELRRADGRHLRILNIARIDSLEILGWKPPEEFIVKAADDTTDLHGILYKPFDFDPNKKYPLIHYVYGDGPIVPRTFIPNGMGGEVQALAQLGFIAIMLDARGSGGRGKAFRDVVYGKVGYHEIADHVAALHQLAETRPYIDLSRVGITGDSYGGYMALHGILSAPDVYHVAVATAPIIELGRHPNQLYLGPPDKNRDGYEYTSNVRLAENLKGKLLLVHGTADTAIPLGHIMRMVDALIKANKPFDLLIMPGESHETSNIWWGYGNKAKRRYFQKHLKPDGGR